MIGTIYMKKKTVILSLFTLATLISGCGSKADNTNTNETTNNSTTQSPTTNPNTGELADATTGPSWVTDEATLEKAVKESWIVIITKDMNTTKDLTFEGGLKKDGVETPRLLALYNQDENRNKTASYTLTAPKMTFKEDGSRIKGGTVAGDIYVACNNFELVDATVNGNIYFKDQAAKDSFKMDDTSKVTGAMELQK